MTSIQPLLSQRQQGLLLFSLSPRWGDDQFLGGLYFLSFPLLQFGPMGLSIASSPRGAFSFLGVPLLRKSHFSKRLRTTDLSLFAARGSGGGRRLV